VLGANVGLPRVLALDVAVHAGLVREVSEFGMLAEVAVECVADWFAEVDRSTLGP
jgi:hypothetical protein